MEWVNNIHQGDSLEVLKKIPNSFINCCITSPPYWGLRDYGNDKQLGLEKTFHEYFEKLWAIFDEIKRVLKPEGTCWVVLGDSYNGLKTGNTNSSGNNIFHGGNHIHAPNLKKTKQDISNKSLCLIPSRFAIGMIDRGWILRNEIIWYKPSCMPSSAVDRFTVDFEKVFFFVKQQKYYFEQQFDKTKRPNEIGILKGQKGKKRQFKKTDPDYRKGHEQDGRIIITPEKRNKRTVWEIASQKYSEAHFAVYPEKLIEMPILAGCPEKGIILDPFMGAGTTALKALKLDRNFIGIELNQEYIDMAEKRIFNEKAQMKLF